MEIEVKFDQQGRIIPFINGEQITMDVSPFLIFLGTAGMCSAVFVQAFMQQRGMSTEGVRIIQKMSYNPLTNHVSDIDIHVDLPEHFPSKYNKAIKHVIDQCPVKQHLLKPPTFNVITNLDKEQVEA